MKLGPGGAVGFEKGLVFSQASKATLNSVLNLRTYSAANSSRPSFLAWIHVLNVETSSRRCWPPRVTSSSASILKVEARPYSSASCPSHFAAWYALHAVATATTPEGQPPQSQRRGLAMPFRCFRVPMLG